MYKILITGSSGFLGKIIIRNLNNFSLISLGRTPSDIMVDLSQDVPQLDTVSLVVHAAGKAHQVPNSAQQSQEFYDVNVKGTRNLIKGLEQCKSLPKAFVFISSVSVYSVESGKLINETAPLFAKDPYGESKIQAENLIQQWCSKHNVICTILRLPLLAGPNPPGNLGSMIKGIKSGYYFNIAGGKAKKSVVLAEDVAKIIPVVANIGGIYNLTDRYNPNFSELSKLIARQLGKSNPTNIPKWMADIMAKVGDLIGSKAPIDSKKLRKITSDLTFDDSKAVSAFGWNPTPVLQGFKIK